jgi:CBS domain-containing protein
VACDCGAIPVVQDKSGMRPIGIVTDRDIVARTIANDKNPLEMTAGDCMSTHLVTVQPNASLQECLDAMEQNRVRRLLVVDEQGACIGIIAQADIAKAAPGHDTAAMVKEISEPPAPNAAQQAQVAEHFVG